MYASVGPNSVVPVVFALLPDKKYRSYFDLFSNLKTALEIRDLELSATTFISDFEPNIKKCFVEQFPDVSTQGCYFHYAKQSQECSHFTQKKAKNHVLGHL